MNGKKNGLSIMLFPFHNSPQADIFSHHSIYIIPISQSNLFGSDFKPEPKFHTSATQTNNALVRIVRLLRSTCSCSQSVQQIKVKETPKTAWRTDWPHSFIRLGHVQRTKLYKGFARWTRAGTTGFDVGGPVTACQLLSSMVSWRSGIRWVR